MTAKEILAKVKAVFAEPVPPAAPAAPAEPAAPMGVDCVLEDGKVMHCDPDMAIGAKCTIDGQPTPAGDYKTQDGSTVTVDESGTITNVAAPEPMTTDLPPAPTFEERLASLEAAIAKLSTPVAPVLPTGLATEAQLQEANAKIEKYGKVIEGLFELTEKLSEVPTAEPATLTGNKKEQFEKREKKEKRIEAIAEAITQMKQNK